MPNYLGNRSAIVLECPHCKKQNDNHTRITLQPIYTCDGAAGAAIRSKVGTNLGYRVRVKDCKNERCKREFRTIEMPEVCLTALTEALSLSAVNLRRQRGELKQLREAVAAIRHALKPLDTLKMKETNATRIRVL